MFRNILSFKRKEENPLVNNYAQLLKECVEKNDVDSLHDLTSSLTGILFKFYFTQIGPMKRIPMTSKQL
jgi:hypothetical protein